MKRLAVFDRVCKGCGELIPESKAPQAKYCTDICGARVRRRNWELANRDKLLSNKRAYNERRRATPEGKYADHRQRAKSSNIPFTLTFEEWWGLWEPFYEERGLGGYVMCRTDDEGGYELGNVRIDTQANNNREARGCELVYD